MTDPLPQPLTSDRPAPAALLIAALRGDLRLLKAHCAHTNVPWSDVLNAARWNKVQALLLNALHRSGAINDCLVPSSVVRDLKTYRRMIVAQAAQLDIALSELLPAFAAAAVPMLVLKGPTLARLYSTPALRGRTDIDLLIEPRHWPRVTKMLHDMGYTLLDEDHTVRPPISSLLAPDDHQYTRDKDQLLVEVHADYLSTGLLRPDDAAMWRRQRVVPWSGMDIPTLAPEDTLLLIATHMQRHAYTCLIWFYDLCVFLRAEGDRLNWPMAARLAARAGVVNDVYYALSYTEALFGRLIDPDARRLFAPHPVRRLLHELRWDRSRILSLDSEFIRMRETLAAQGKLPSTKFNAYATPQELLVHMIISGNIAPKMRCLVRRLAPTTEWFAYYYPQPSPVIRLRLMLSRALPKDF